jgi:hypothetical protein
MEEPPRSTNHPDKCPLRQYLVGRPGPDGRMRVCLPTGEQALTDLRMIARMVGIGTPDPSGPNWKSGSVISPGSGIRKRRGSASTAVPPRRCEHSTGHELRWTQIPGRRLDSSAAWSRESGSGKTWHYRSGR